MSLALAGQAARHHAADVLPVRHDADDRERALAAKHRIEETDVVQMRAAGVRIVVQVEIAGPDVVAVLGDHRPRRPRERRDVRRLLELRRGDEIALRRQDGRREIVAFDDHPRVGGANDDRAHLAHDRGEPRLHQLGRDRIRIGLRACWFDISSRSHGRLTSHQNDSNRTPPNGRSRMKRREASRALALGLGGAMLRSAAVAVPGIGHRAGTAAARARSAAAGIRDSASMCRRSRRSCRSCLRCRATPSPRLHV